MSNLSDELDEILDFNTDESNGAFPKKLRDYYKQAILDLIEREKREARIDEVTRMKDLTWDTRGLGERIVTINFNRRLAELRGEDD